MSISQICQKVSKRRRAAKTAAAVAIAIYLATYAAGLKAAALPPLLAAAPLTFAAGCRRPLLAAATAVLYLHLSALHAAYLHSEYEEIQKILETAACVATAAAAALSAILLSK